jgi:hypothetical protein
MFDAAPGYWHSRFLFERALALIYLVAFLCAANQFVPLLGEHGLLPVPRFVRAVPFRLSPSLFYAAPTDRAFTIAAWAGVALSLVALSGVAGRVAPLAPPVVWALLWLLYLSFVNVGQTFYGFGWETLLLETGFLAIFAGAATVAPNTLWLWLWRWLLFRVMFGAGLIKLRGDECWRNLTCLDYYFETQPMPNALSWYFHWMPAGVHRAGVVINHVVELGVPFAYFAPQPVASVAAIVTILFQLILIASGNLSWLNWITIVLCLPVIDGRWLTWLPVPVPALADASLASRTVVAVVAAGVAMLSVNPIVNMLSPAQVMNTSFEPLHLVNTYGAFGSITRVRHEIVIEGTSDLQATPASVWREYEFKGKPGDPARRPAQIAPYHLRIDWLMWFAAMSDPDDHPWFFGLVEKLLRGDRATVALLASNPFPDAPPHLVRASYYAYRFTTADERRSTGRWWKREPIGSYFGPVSLRQ